MLTALAKSEMLLSDCLKCLGYVSESVPPLKRALASPALERRPILRAFVQTFLADSYSLLGDEKRADDLLQAATSVSRDHGARTALAYISLVEGQRARLRGDLQGALRAYGDARLIYDDLVLKTRSAYARILSAEVLLGLGKEREAEAEIAAALPAIETGQLLREGAAAISMLRESVRRRKTDRDSLRSVAHYLKSRN